MAVHRHAGHVMPTLTTAATRTSPLASAPNASLAHRTRDAQLECASRTRCAQKRMCLDPMRATKQERYCLKGFSSSTHLGGKHNVLALPALHPAANVAIGAALSLSLCGDWVPARRAIEVPSCTCCVHVILEGNRCLFDA